MVLVREDMLGMSASQGLNIGLNFFASVHHNTQEAKNALQKKAKFDLLLVILYFPTSRGEKYQFSHRFVQRWRCVYSTLYINLLWLKPKP